MRKFTKKMEVAKFPVLRLSVNILFLNQSRPPYHQGQEREEFQKKIPRYGRFPGANYEIWTHDLFLTKEALYPWAKSAKNLKKNHKPRWLWFFVWAEDEGRTRDIQLGRLTLYQLSYFRICVCTHGWFRSANLGNFLSYSCKLFYKMWGEQDSNLRSRKTAELQSDPFGHSGISPIL